MRPSSVSLCVLFAAAFTLQVIGTVSITIGFVLSSKQQFVAEISQLQTETYRCICDKLNECLNTALIHCQNVENLASHDLSINWLVRLAHRFWQQRTQFSNLPVSAIYVMADYSSRPINVLAARMQARNAALIQSKVKFSKIFHSIQRLIIISRIADNYCLSAEFSTAQFFGSKPSQTGGKAGSELQIWIDPEECKESAASLQNNQAIQNRECWLRSKAGTIERVLLSKELNELEDQPRLLRNPQVHQAAQTVNNPENIRLVEQLPRTHQPLTKTIKSLAQNYRSDTIFQVTEQLL